MENEALDILQQILDSQLRTERYQQLVAAAQLWSAPYATPEQATLMLDMKESTVREKMRKNELPRVRKSGHKFGLIPVPLLRSQIEQGERNNRAIEIEGKEKALRILSKVS